MNFNSKNFKIKKDTTHTKLDNKHSKKACNRYKDSILGRQC